MVFSGSTVICTENRERVEESMARRRYSLESRGMKMNRHKTKYVCGNEWKTVGNMNMPGVEIVQANPLKYQGSIV